MTSFRDRFFTPKVARAITSPSAILATGAGVSVGILAGGVVAPFFLGAAALAARVLIAVPRPERRPVDTKNLIEPWKSLLAEIIDSGNRFQKATAGMQDGPLKQRLADLGSNLETAINDAARVAHAGNQLSNARSQINTARVQQDLDYARSEPASPRRDQTITAIESQLASAARIDSTTRDTYEQLRLLDARIDEMVARSVELSVSQTAGEDLSGLGEEAEAIVSDMESLRVALEETH